MNTRQKRLRRVTIFKLVINSVVAFTFGIALFIIGYHDTLLPGLKTELYLVGGLALGIMTINFLYVYFRYLKKEWIVYIWYKASIKKEWISKRKTKIPKTKELRRIEIFHFFTVPFGLNYSISKYLTSLFFVFGTVIIKIPSW